MSGNYSVVKEWRSRNKDKVNAQAVRYRKKHPDKFKATQSRYRGRNLEMVREQDRLRQAARRQTPEYKKAQLIRNKNYKTRLLALQEELAGRSRALYCELCGRKGGGFNNDPTVFDHDHKTGKFRGWLCHWCNRTLGMVHDDVELLKTMVVYIEHGGYGNGKVELSTKKKDV